VAVVVSDEDFNLFGACFLPEAAARDFVFGDFDGVLIDLVFELYAEGSVIEIVVPFPLAALNQERATHSLALFPSFPECQSLCPLLEIESASIVAKFDEDLIRAKIKERNGISAPRRDESHS